ncbi:MAG: hypothetical protein ACE5E6_11745, partial [Phycisphaerae bacterium]
MNDRPPGRVLVLAGMSLTMGVVGCSDPRFKVKQARRDAAIRRRLDDNAAREACRPGMIQGLLDYAAAARDAHARKLDTTMTRWANRHRRRVRDWHARADEREARWAHMLAGRPDRIGDAFADMA